MMVIIWILRPLPIAVHPTIKANHMTNAQTKTLLVLLCKLMLMLTVFATTHIFYWVCVQDGMVPAVTVTTSSWYSLL